VTFLLYAYPTLCVSRLKKPCPNRVRLRTIITYDFMLYGSRRFRGRISRSASLTASTKTRLEIVAHFRDLERLTRFLLHQMTMLENQRAPGPRRQLAPSGQNSAQICAKWSFLSQTTIYPRYTFPPFGSSKSIGTSE
jgi:hypothetical protein